MHARVAIGQVTSGKEDEAIRLGREVALPHARQQPGYRGLISFLDRATGKTMVITLWATEADLLAMETTNYAAQQLARLATVTSGPATREILAVEVLATEPGAAVAARVFTLHVNPAMVDEAIATGREAIQVMSREQPGFRAALALVDRATGKDYTMSLWATEADRQAGEQNNYVREVLAKVGPYVVGPVTREAFEVVIADLPA
jgi:heme-degrading monooxygenase HmoA